MVHHWIRLCEQGARFCGETNLQIEFLQIGPQSGFSRYLDTHFFNIHIPDIFNSSGKLCASFSDFATILHHYFATSAFFQKSKKHLPAALLLLKFNLPKI